MTSKTKQDADYLAAVEQYGFALQRLARAAEADAERQYDLLQDIHLALWQSFALFDDRCSVGTWVFRVAHNATASYVYREKRHHGKPNVHVDTDQMPDSLCLESVMADSDALEQLYRWIRSLKPLDSQVMTLYLEELAAKDIADITGLTAGAVATRISRLKKQLADEFEEINHG
ncbi:MAG: RNA polymerase sigma factor [Granulosicoccus sp.]